MANLSADDVQRSAKRAVSEVAPWVQRLAHLGFTARGLVYLIIGALALQSARGQGGQTTDAEGAMQTVLQHRYGWLLLIVIMGGFAGYAIWRFVEATMDPGAAGSRSPRLIKRAAYAISGAIHVSLAVEAARLAIGLGGRRGGDSGPQDWTALVLAQPMGRWLVVAVGMGIAIFGASELLRAYRTDLPKELDLGRLGHAAREWVVRFGRMGLAARGVVFIVIGGFAVRAAATHDASQARGLAGALKSLQEQPYGPGLLAAVAIGLIAFGLFELVESRYRRIRAA